MAQASNFKLLLIRKSLKLSSYIVLKNMLKISISAQYKKSLFSNLAYNQRAPKLVPQDLTS